MKNPYPSSHFETQAVRTQATRSGFAEHSVPIYLTSSYLFESAEHAQALFDGSAEGMVYSRYDNPSNDEFIDKMRLLEGTKDGLATATGMAAVFGALAGTLSSGDHVLACRSLFGSSHQILTQVLPRFGITSSYFDLDQPDRWEEQVRPQTKLVFVETPTNPGLDLVDLERLSQLCRKRGLRLVVDNCFATPYLQKPAEWGADLVVHSATKFIDGQGRGLGGVILGSQELMEPIRFFCRQTGPSLSPFHGWMFSKSLETLAVRMDRHCDNAEALAHRLEGHPALSRVKHPALSSHPQHALAQRQMRRGGALLTLDLKSGLEGGQRFLNALELCSLTANLGDTRTTATHPASTTHSKLSDQERSAVGIGPGTVRISVGLEHVDDIADDLLQALSRATRSGA